MPQSPLTIEFHHSGQAPLDAPPPAPMREVSPQWLSAMPALIPDAERRPEDKSSLTLRACAPFLEAMSFGYALLWPLAVTLTVLAREADGSFDVRCDPVEPMLFESHPPRQAPGMPGTAFPILKLLSPWIIRTPPDTCCMITPLLNRPELKLVPYAGIVETDRYFNAINLPCMLLARPGDRVEVRRGEPIAQVLPLRRDDWQAVRGAGDVDAAAATRAVLDATDGGAYAQRIRVRRSFR